MSQTPREQRPVQARRITEVSPAQRRRALARALASMIITFGAIVGLYYVVPLSAKEFQLRSILRLTAAGVAFLAVLAWQVHQIVRAELPALRAVQAVVLAVPLFLTGYAWLYLIVSAAGGNFSEDLTRTSALYFTVVVFSSVGFGDITPTSDASRILVMSQMLGGLVFLAVVVRVFFAASRLSLQRGQATAADDDRADRD